MSKNIYANTIALYQSNYLLGQDRLHRLKSADFLDCLKILTASCFFGDTTPTPLCDIDFLINEQIKNLIDFVKEYSPNKDLTQFLLCQFDYSDYKTYYNYARFDIDFFDSVVVKNDDLRGAFLAKNYSSFPKELADCFDKLDADPSLTPVKAKLSLLNSEFLKKLDLAKKLTREFENYTKTQIDLTNLLSVFRIKKMDTDLGQSVQSDKDFVLSQLLKFGFVEGEDYLSLFEEYSDAYSLLSDKDYFAFDDFVFKFLYQILNKDFSAGSLDGFAPFLHYFFSRLLEIKQVKYLLVCKKNNIALYGDFGGDLNE